MEASENQQLPASVVAFAPSEGTPSAYLRRYLQARVTIPYLDKSGFTDTGTLTIGMRPGWS